METYSITNKVMVESLAKLNGISKARASLLLNLVAAEMEIPDSPEMRMYGPHTAAEVERQVAAKLAKATGADRRIKRPTK
jgi:hypothetical protein